MLVSLVGFITTKPSLARPITPEAAPGGTSTTVTPSGNRFDIGGGRLSGDGKNLFHSFTNFGLEQNQIANFLSQPAIQNILSRVNGGNASVINGIIQVSGGNSNLFLINPAGIVFGQNASLNVPASFSATTANGIGFGSNGWFSASGANDYASLVGTPSTLAFTTGQAGAIVNAANLAMQQGQSLTLAGGTVVSTGQLSAPGGNIIVAAVPGTSLVRITQPGSPLSLEIQPITPGSSQPNPWNNSVLSLPQLVTGGGGNHATRLSVNPDGTVQLTGSGIRVENGDVVVNNLNTSSTASSVNGGSIVLSAQRNINTTLGTLNSSFSSTDSSARGNGGAITLSTLNGDIATGDLNSFSTSGNGGAITLATLNGNIATGNLDSHGSFSESAAAVDTGNGGAIALTTVKGNIATGNLDSRGSSSSSAAANSGNGGKIDVTTRNGSITTGNLDSRGSSSSSAAADTGDGNGGALTLTTVNGSIATGNLDSGGVASSPSSSAAPDSGNGGAIAVITVNGSIATGNLNSSGSFSTTAFPFPSDSGNGGAIALTTFNGNITTGFLNAESASGSGNGGAIALATFNGNIATGSIDSIGAFIRGNGGAIALTTFNGNIATGSLNASGARGVIGSGNGNGAAITLTTQNGNITTDDLIANSGPRGGSGGPIALTSQNGNIAVGNLITSGVGFLILNDSGSGLIPNPGSGLITLITQNGNITTGNLNSSGFGGAKGGAITLITQNGNIATDYLVSSVNTFSYANGGAVSVSAGNSISIGQINSRSGLGNGGAVSVSAGNSISIGQIDSSNSYFLGNGGAVSISAGNSISIGQINSSSVSENGGEVTLNAGKDIAVSSINAQGGSPSEFPLPPGNGGTGGSVNLTAGDTIRISDSFTALDGTTASISTQGGTGGGAIRIITGGGIENPFKVGDPTTNGTAKDITSGEFRISSTPVFTVPSPIYTQGNIEIITLP